MQYKSPTVWQICKEENQMVASMYYMYITGFTYDVVMWTYLPTCVFMHNLLKLLQSVQVPTTHWHEEV